MRTLTALVLFFCTQFLTSCQSVSVQTDDEIKLYIFDNGLIVGLEPELFNFTLSEVAETDFVLTSYLIVHPQGALLWESGGIPDHDFPADGSSAIEGVVSATKTLRSQMSEIGYEANDIDYYAMSHLHSDHNANSNEFSGSHWIVQKNDREVMFSGVARDIMVPENFADLKDAQTILLDDEDYDVFGDGTVQIISAPGHTEGHQVLLLKLPESGNIMLAGDLFHYPEEITTGRFPTFEYDPELSAISREKVMSIVEDNDAELWIGHDKVTHQGLNFSPAFYR